MYALTQKYPQKRAFITGAGSGLGRAFALELAAEGWTIGMADNNPKALDEVGGLVAKAGGKPLIYLLDVADKDQYKEIAERFLFDAEGIDLLFNNAGVGDGSEFESYSLENYEWMVGINQMGVLYGCWYFVPAMKKQGYGHILNTASAAAIGCAPTMAGYNMTKAAVVAISETLYSELYDFGIHVSCIQPTYFKTNIAQSVRGGAATKKITQTFIERSGLEANEVAKEILIRAGNKELYIILPKAARTMWKLKRLAPTWFRLKVKDQFMNAMNKALSKKVNRMKLNEAFSLKGKVALITGASKGIGEAIAQYFAASDAAVVINSRKQEELDKVAASIQETGGICTGIAGNAGDIEACKILVQKTVELYGGIDILVNNAASNPVYGPVVTCEEWAFDKIMNVNVKAPFELGKLVYPIMKERGGGSVINISSIAGITPDPGLGLYSVSKAALNMLTKVTAKEWGVDGIRVNAICPGLIKTKFSEALWQDEKWLNRFVKMAPISRMGSVDEIAALALFLAAPASGYCTGTLFTADGGVTI